MVKMLRIILLLALIMYIGNSQQVKFTSSLCMQSASSIIMFAQKNWDGTPVCEKLIRSIDDGTTWHEIVPPERFTMMTFPDSLTGYAIPWIENNEKGAYRLYKTTDGGETWMQKADWGPLEISGSVQNPVPYMRCEFTDSRTGYVGMCISASDRVSLLAYKTTDGGDTWSRYSADSLVLYNLACNRWVVMDSLHVFSMSVYPPVGTKNYRSNDGGMNWYADFDPDYLGEIRYMVPIQNAGLAVYSIQPSGKFYEYAIIVSYDTGYTWNGSYRFKTQSGQDISSVAFFNTIYGVAFSSYYGDTWYDTTKYMPIKTNDGGLTWEVFKSPFPTPPDGYVDCSLWKNGTGYATNAYELIKTTDYGATWRVIPFTLDMAETNSQPEKLGLSRTYPNPVSRRQGYASIQYRLPNASYVRLIVYDMMGRETCALVEAFKSPGSYTERLDVSGLTPGVYLITMLAGNNPPAVRRMVVK